MKQTQKRKNHKRGEKGGSEWVGGWMKNILRVNEREKKENKKSSRYGKFFFPFSLLLNLDGRYQMTIEHLNLIEIFELMYDFSWKNSLSRAFFLRKYFTVNTKFVT